MPVITSGFGLNSLFSYVNVTTNFASKTMSTVDSIANNERGGWCWFSFCFGFLDLGVVLLFLGFVCVFGFFSVRVFVSGNNVPKNRGKLKFTAMLISC